MMREFRNGSSCSRASGGFPPRRWCCGWMVPGLIAAVLLGGRAVMPAATPSETELKAAFLVNFPKYVEWPAMAFATSNSPVVVAVYGETALHQEVSKLIAGRSVNGRPLEYQAIRTEAELNGDFHLVFIAGNPRRRLAAVLGRLRDRPVLTVGEAQEFVERGGMINLTLRDQRVRVDVNLEPARRGNLKISSKLLAVADQVKGR